MRIKEALTPGMMVPKPIMAPQSTSRQVGICLCTVPQGTSVEDNRMAAARVSKGNQIYNRKPFICLSAQRRKGASIKPINRYLTSSS